MGDELARPARRLVECHSGYAYAERPVALSWEDQRVNIDRVVAEWRTPGGKRFRVRVRDGRIFELFYEERSGDWQINPS